MSRDPKATRAATPRQRKSESIRKESAAGDKRTQETHIVSPSSPQAPSPSAGTSKNRPVSPVAGTLHDLLKHDALDALAQDVRRYLLRRCGDENLTDQVFAELREEAATLGPDKLAEAPGPRGRLYAMARKLLAATPGSFSRSQKPPVEHPLLAHPESELLELNLLRGLKLGELAFVFCENEATTAGRLQGALSDAQALLAPGAELKTAFREACEESDESKNTPDPNTGELPPVPAGVVLDGRYRLEAHIGSGGFADVYRATDIAVPGHVVALKVLKRPARTQLERDTALRELRLIAAVFHPSIVQFKDHGWYERRFWFVMPWYEGESLEQRLEQGPISRAEARRIFEPLARALATMHANGIRHQDVKPDNIFLAQLRGFGMDAEAKYLPVLLDLGVAAEDSELLLAGTPTYFAPEVAGQFAGTRAPGLIGPAADVFALALSLRNALDPDTQPTIGDGGLDAFIAERAEEVPAPSKRPELRFLDSSFRRWMSMDPEKRPSADELADELAILTLPEERRERRLRALRTFGPIIAMILVVTGTIFWELHQRALLHEAKVESITSDLDEAREELEQENKDQEALRLEIEEAEARIHNSQLSRTQLETQLAVSEAERHHLVESLRSSRAQRRRLHDSLTDREGELSEARQQLESERNALATSERQLRTRTEELQTARSESAAAEAQLSSVRQELRQAQAAQSAAESQASEIRASLRSLQQRFDAAEAALSRAERAQSQAEQNQRQAESARDAARAEQRRLESEVASLRRRIAALEASAMSAAPSPTPSMSMAARRRR